MSLRIADNKAQSGTKHHFLQRGHRMGFLPSTFWRQVASQTPGQWDFAT